MTTFYCLCCRKSVTVPAEAALDGQVCPRCQNNLGPAQAAGPRWFLAHNEQTHGPYTWQQLVTLARHGNLDPDAMLFKEGTQRWVRAGTLHALFAAPAPPKSPEPAVHQGPLAATAHVVRPAQVPPATEFTVRAPVLQELQTLFGQSTSVSAAPEPPAAAPELTMLGTSTTETNTCTEPAAEADPPTPCATESTASITPEPAASAPVECPAPAVAATVDTSSAAAVETTTSFGAAGQSEPAAPVAMIPASYNPRVLLAMAATAEPTALTTEPPAPSPDADLPVAAETTEEPAPPAADSIVTVKATAPSGTPWLVEAVAAVAFSVLLSLFVSFVFYGGKRGESPRTEIPPAAASNGSPTTEEASSLEPVAAPQRR